jgi:hypothetical protein
VVGSLTPALGHAAVSRILSMRRGRPADVSPPPPPEDVGRPAATPAETLGIELPPDAPGATAAEPARAPSDLERLQAHLYNALARLERDGLTPNQSESLDANPYLEGAHKGERIDKFSKESIADDRTLRHLVITPRFQFGPDFIDPINNSWYDITTLRQWPRHEKKYGPQFGQGTPLFYGDK